MELTTEKVLNERDAARFLSLSEATLRMRRHRRLPPNYIKLGRSVRYYEGSLRELLQANLQVMPTAAGRG